MSYTPCIALSTKENWVDERLRFVEVLEEKYSYPDEAEKNSKVVCDDVV